MSGKTTNTMIRMYEQKSTPTLFFAGMYDAPEGNFYESENVEFDIVRDDEDIAIVVDDLSTGTRMNEGSLYTNKSFLPPILDEGIALNSWDMIKRQPGEDPFKSPAFRANITGAMLRGMIKIGGKIGRTIELQAAQALQTGTITLVDTNGDNKYTIDFKPKATHFPTVGTAWDAVGADPMGDIDALAEVNRNDGKLDSDMLVFGKDALRVFLQNEDVQAHLDNRRINKGDVVRTQNRGEGGKYHGSIDILHYTYEIWSYGGRYKHPQTGTMTQYMDPAKVIVKSTDTRLDATFGGIPNIGQELGFNPINLPELPSRMMAGGLGLIPLVYPSPDGRHLFGSVAARPLMIPTAIDTYGCLTTGL